MYVGRKMEELEDIPLHQWDLNELAFHHDVMSQLVAFMNQEGVALHRSIIEEIENRGGMPRREGAWDHASRIIYD